MVRFHFLTGDVNWQEYGGKFVSDRCNNGDFDYWYVMQVIPYGEVLQREGNGEKYGVMLTVVAPSEVSDEKRQAALNSWGMDTADMQKFSEQYGDLAWVEVLSEYGIAALVWQDNGNNLSKLMAQARQETRKSETFFGFIMDKPQNALGTDGWSFLKGEVLAGIGIHS